MIDKSLLIKNKNINTIELFIGHQKQSNFDCVINDNLFNKIIKFFPKKNRCIYSKYYYKNMVYEHINNNISVYETKYLITEKYNKCLINFLERIPKNKIEFPCKKKYIHEEHFKGFSYTIDDSAVLYFFEELNCIKLETNIDNKHEINFNNINSLLNKICSVI